MYMPVSAFISFMVFFTFFVFCFYTKNVLILLLLYSMLFLLWIPLEELSIDSWVWCDDRSSEPWKGLLHLVIWGYVEIFPTGPAGSAISELELRMCGEAFRSLKHWPDCKLSLLITTARRGAPRSRPVSVLVSLPQQPLYSINMRVPWQHSGQHASLMANSHVFETLLRPGF